MKHDTALTLICVIACLILLGGCRRPEPSKAKSTSAAPKTNESQNSDDAQTLQEQRLPTARFHRLAAAHTGIDFENRLIADHPNRRLYHSGFVAGGIAIGDIDGDKLPDVFLASGSGSNRLYKNMGDFRFKDVTDTAGVDGGSAWGTGVVMVDIDNDGDLDLYVCSYDAANQLYVNNGSGRFIDEAAKWKLDIVDATLSASFHDFDHDGDLDVYLLNNRYYRKGGRPQRPPYAVKNGRIHILEEYQKYFALSKNAKGDYGVDDYGRPDRFLRNDGSSFTEITKEAGIAGNGYGLSVTWWDYDDDGLPDIYVCNDFNDPDRLYRNNGDGTFTNKLREALPHTPWFSMGSDAGDLNNDGLVDFLCVDMSATTHYKQKTTMGAMNAKQLAAVAGPPPQYMRNALYLNTGTGRCMEVAQLTGLADTDWSWAVKLADFDHDGKLDVFVSNGMVRSFNNSDVPFNTGMLIGKSRWDLYQHLPTRPEQNLAYRNRGDLRFEDVSKSWGLDHVGMSYGTALADLDGDFDLDMIVVNVDEPVSVYRNDVAQGVGLTIRLEGAPSNRFGLGAKLELYSKHGTQVRHMNPATGFLSCNQPIVHFGVGDGDLRKLVVTWPSGRQQTIGARMLKGHLIVREYDARSQVAQRRNERETLFVESTPIHYAHRERPFDDFELQPLLPNRLSQLGPGLAVADIDRDGDEDAFVGGAAGKSGVVLFNQGSGRYQPRTSPAFSDDIECEDMGCLFFDANSDGHTDLYVVSGGVEAHQSPELFRDRLYLNNGQGGFSKAPPDHLGDSQASGSFVVANDFDRDGDLDLVVGGRVLPGQYPLSPGSRLLQNDGGRFTDVTQEVAPDLAKCGMATAAVCSDVDADGWNDLVVAVEWGPVRFYQNRNGKLVEKTDSATIQGMTGWFNGLAARDLDHDGDVDFVVTNFGLNTKYHASISQPALLYYGDFEKTGRMRLVEAEFEDETLFPIRGKSCSTHAMPFLKNKFASYEDFALADLNQLYTHECLEESHRFAATELRSGVLLNQGDFKFSFKPLPRLAQASPGIGVAITEVNGDASPDIYLVQNFHGAQPETGNMDGGMSLLLTGEGDGSFKPVWPAKSGLIVLGDATAIATTDANNDGLGDFLVCVNNDKPQCFLRRPDPKFESSTIVVELRGRRGNANAVGARVTVKLKNATTQTAEIHAGSGYLTQSSSRLTFGTAGSEVEEINVRWPDGTTSKHQGHEGRSYRIRKGAK